MENVDLCVLASLTALRSTEFVYFQSKKDKRWSRPEIFSRLQLHQSAALWPKLTCKPQKSEVSLYKSQPAMTLLLKKTKRNITCPQG